MSKGAIPYLSIEDGTLTFRDHRGKLHKGIRTPDELIVAFTTVPQELLDVTGIMCSSSVDFPEEFTDDKEVLRTIQWFVHDGED